VRVADRYKGVSRRRKKSKHMRGGAGGDELMNGRSMSRRAHSHRHQEEQRCEEIHTKNPRQKMQQLIQRVMT
jgi:hypothetical protein